MIRAHRILSWQAAACVLVGAALPPGASRAAEPPPPRWMASHYAAALSAYRQARYPEAYGRFIVMAEWGYAPAARHALLMCEYGPALFGRPFDCAPHEIEAWALQVGRDPGEAVRRIHPSLVADVVAARARR